MDLMEMKFNIWWTAKYKDVSRNQSQEYTLVKDAWNEAIKTYQEVENHKIAELI